jgi:hypothetical protein
MHLVMTQEQDRRWPLIRPVAHGCVTAVCQGTGRAFTKIGPVSAAFAAVLADPLQRRSRLRRYRILRVIDPLRMGLCNPADKPLRYAAPTLPGCQIFWVTATVYFGSFRINALPLGRVSWYFKQNLLDGDR